MYIGQPIHIRIYDIERCVFAVITDIRMNVITNATVFTPHGPYGEAARRIAMTPNTEWHDLDDCQYGYGRQRVGNSSLDEALNMGDGSYRP